MASGPFFRFALPTIIMMIFMSLYTIVDGIFVCRLGSSALSAVNRLTLVSVVIGLGSCWPPAAAPWWPEAGRGG